MITCRFNKVVFVRFGTMILLSTALLTRAAIEQPVLPGAIKAKVQKAVAIKKADDRLKALADIGADLALTNIAPALAQAESFKELRERVVFTQAVLSRWSALAPEEAFHHIAGLPENIVKVEAIKFAAIRFAVFKPAAAAAATLRMKAGPARNEAAPLVAETWARTNVQAALAWAQTLPETFPREPVLYAIRFIWVHSEPISAVPHVMALPPDEIRNALLMNIAGAWAALDPHAAWKWADTLPGDTARDIILNNVIESWADTEPRAAADFALKQSDSARRDRLAQMALSRWATQNSQAAMEWLVNYPSASFHEQAAPDVLRIWASANPAETSAWVSKLPAGNVREIVLQACLEPLSEWDLAGSVALAAQLANPSTRLKHIQPVLEKWFARQPEAARAWIGKSSFSEEIKASWLTGSFAVEAVPAPASEK